MPLSVSAVAFTSFGARLGAPSWNCTNTHPLARVAQVQSASHTLLHVAASAAPNVHTCPGVNNAQCVVRGGAPAVANSSGRGPRALKRHCRTRGVVEMHNLHPDSLGILPSRCLRAWFEALCVDQFPGLRERKGRAVVTLPFSSREDRCAATRGMHRELSRGLI
eukprot:350156-Chlamydomonas_euryale.AAC.7